MSLSKLKSLVSKIDYRYVVLEYLTEDRQIHPIMNVLRDYLKYKRFDYSKGSQSQASFSFKGPAEGRQTGPTESCYRTVGFRSLLLAFVQGAGRRPAKASSHKTGGFTLLETLIGLVVVSITCFVVAFMSANMTTSTQRKHDTYMCSSIAGNVLAHFSKNGSKVIAKQVPTIKKMGGGTGTPGVEIEHNVSGDSPPLSSSSSGVTLNLDRLYDGSDVGVLEDLYNKYLKISPTNPISICPSDAQISNSSALTFDLVKMEFKSHESSAPLIKLGDLDKWVEENPNKYRKLKDEDKRTAQQGLADNNGSSSDGYKWDRLTGESLFLLSERLSDISSLSFGPVEPVSSYTPVSNYIAKSKYEVRIGIRPWDISKNEKTDSCNRHKSKAIHPIFVRPRSVYDKPENSDKSKLGYKLASSLSGLPEANIRHDLGFKLFVEVEERKAVSSYDPIRCRAEKMFSYSPRYRTSYDILPPKTTADTQLGNNQANQANNSGNTNKMLANKLANKANSPSTVSLSSISNSEASTSTTASQSKCTRKTEGGGTYNECKCDADDMCEFRVDGRVWDRGGDELDSNFSKNIFLCRLKKTQNGTTTYLDWALCGDNTDIGDGVITNLYAGDPKDGDRSNDKHVYLKFEPPSTQNTSYAVELRLVDQYGNYHPRDNKDKIVFTSLCADVTCTGIQRCNSATGRCECPANHASCRNNAICCNPGNICVNNGCACDDTACGLLGKVCSEDTSLADRCVSQHSCSGPSDCNSCQECVGGKCIAQAVNCSNHPTHKESSSSACTDDGKTPEAIGVCDTYCYKCKSTGGGGNTGGGGGNTGDDSGVDDSTGNDDSTLSDPDPDPDPDPTPDEETRCKPDSATCTICINGSPEGCGRGRFRLMPHCKPHIGCVQCLNSSHCPTKQECDRTTGSCKFKTLHQ